MALAAAARALAVLVLLTLLLQHTDATFTYTACPSLSSVGGLASNHLDASTGTQLYYPAAIEDGSLVSGSFRLSVLREDSTWLTTLALPISMTDVKPVLADYVWEDLRGRDGCVECVGNTAECDTTTTTCDDTGLQRSYHLNVDSDTNTLEVWRTSFATSVLLHSVTLPGSCNDPSTDRCFAEVWVSEVSNPGVYALTTRATAGDNLLVLPLDQPGAPGTWYDVDVPVISATLRIIPGVLTTAYPTAGIIAKSHHLDDKDYLVFATCDASGALAPAVSWAFYHYSRNDTAGTATFEHVLTHQGVKTDTEIGDDLMNAPSGVVIVQSNHVTLLDTKAPTSPMVHDWLYSEADFEIFYFWIALNDTLFTVGTLLAVVACSFFIHRLYFKRGDAGRRPSRRRKGRRASQRKEVRQDLDLLDRQPEMAHAPTKRPHSMLNLTMPEVGVEGLIIPRLAGPIPPSKGEVEPELEVKDLQFIERHGGVHPVHNQDLIANDPKPS